jgi:hypothetical protein
LVALKAAYFSGTHVSDDLFYRQAARAMNRGTFEPRDHFSGRVAFIVPLALGERIAGGADFVAAVVPGACWIVEVLAIAWIGGVLISSTAGRIAGVLAATAPNALFWSGFAMTDVPASAFMTLSVAFFLRGARSSSLGWACASGVSLGWAWLQRESAILAALAIGAFWLSRRARGRDVLTAAACCLGVVLVEAGYFLFAVGDPLGRFHLATGPSFGAEHFWRHSHSLLERLTYQIPSMLVNPADPAFVYSGILFGGALLASVRRRVTEPLVWFGALFVGILLLPISLSPYRPAVIAHPKNLLALAAPTCLALGAGLASLRPAWRWGTAGAIVAAHLAFGWVLKFDNDYRLDGARAALEFLRQRGAPCVADERTAFLYEIWDGPGRARTFGDERPGDTVVINEHWLEFMKTEYGKEPPRVDPGWSREFSRVTPARLRLRPLLAGRFERAGPGYVTTVYRVGFR